MSSLSRNEAEILKRVLEYIEGTYGQHYTMQDKNEKQPTQLVDILHGMGIIEEFCIGNAIKYVARFGRKEGKNIKDLYKAMHYIVFLIHYSGILEDEKPQCEPSKEIEDPFIESLRNFQEENIDTIEKIKNRLTKK